METPRRKFFRCGYCGFSWAHPDSLPDEAAAAQRYSNHRNDAADQGYTQFLSGIIEKAFFYYSGKPESVIDWGSGPSPVASRMLEGLGLSVFSWDPNFSSSEIPRKEFYDLGVCIETAEHFIHPRKDFADFFRTLKPGAYAVIHTHLAPADDDAFLRWWYIEDITHVSFYSRYSLEILGAMVSARVIAVENEKLAVFRKPLPVIVAGGVNLDIEGVPFEHFIPRDSNPGVVKFSPGGTGRNIAENAARLGLTVELVSAIGNDPFGKQISEVTEQTGVGIAGLEQVPGESTSTYVSILDGEGDMVSAISGMGIFDRITPDIIKPALERAMESAFRKSYRADPSCPFSLLILDANLPPETLLYIRERFKSIPAWFDPVSTTKAKRVAEYQDGILLNRLDFVKPNLIEAFALTGRAPGDVPGTWDDESMIVRDVLEELYAKGIKYLCISLGEKGVLAYKNGTVTEFKPPEISVVSATGAGDSFVAGAIWSYLVHGDDFLRDIRSGSAAAGITLISAKAVSDDMSAGAVESKILEWEHHIRG